MTNLSLLSDNHLIDNCVISSSVIGRIVDEWMESVGGYTADSEMKLELIIWLSLTWRLCLLLLILLLRSKLKTWDI